LDNLRWEAPCPLQVGQRFRIGGRQALELPTLEHAKKALRRTKYH
jgi:hypothetical protein